MADQISDAILDAILRKDANARVACETATTTGTVIVLGEITTDAYVEFQEIIRETVRAIGYTDAAFGFGYRMLPWIGAGLALLCAATAFLSRRVDRDEPIPV